MTQTWTLPLSEASERLQEVLDHMAAGGVAEIQQDDGELVRLQAIAVERDHIADTETVTIALAWL